MSSLRHIFAWAIALLIAATLPALAQMTALARVDGEESRISDRGEGAEIVLWLSQPVPWRVFTLDEPRRLVIDLAEAIWPADLSEQSAWIDRTGTGAAGQGWSRLVLDLSGPVRIAEAGMQTGFADGHAVLRLVLLPAGEADFAAAAGLPDVLQPRDGTGIVRKARVRDPEAPLRVVIDPGHGGIDPGAEAGGLREADLMLGFARELRDILRRSGGFEVHLTRDADIFVPLEARITIARAAGADVFLSLHADALPEGSGNASGATIYTLSRDASDDASRKLAERHDQTDLLSGVNLEGQGDEIALVLMDLARTETEPRTNALADMLVEAIRESVGRVNSRPRRSANFSVLKSPDFPSILLELGFLSSSRDRERLQDPAYRRKMAEGIRDGLVLWELEDRLRGAGPRR